MPNYIAVIHKDQTVAKWRESMRIAVLGAGGGLGRNVVDAARAAKHDVVALCAIRNARSCRLT